MECGEIKGFHGSTVLFDRFMPLECLSNHSFRTVHLCVDLRSGSRCVLKTLINSAKTNRALFSAYNTEIEIGSKIRHPHLVTCQRVLDEKFISAFMMPYFTRGSLEYVLLEEEPTLGLASVLRIAQQLCSALEHVHEHGVLHRDIKPANVLLDENGDAFLCDFGLAVFAKSVADDPDSGLVGTLSHIAPETIQEGVHDCRSDLYSLGLVLYEALVGLRISDNTPVVEQLMNRIFEELPPPSDIVAECPKAISEVIMRAIHRDPCQRYSSVHEFKLALLKAAAPLNQRGKPWLRAA